MGNRLEVVRAGALTTVQDFGRRGYAHQAVPRSGALDPRAMRLANRLVGNAEDAAALEATMGELTLRFDVDAVIAVTGAPCPVRVGGRAGSVGAPVHVRAGDVLELGVPETGLRTYVAVRGGIDVTPVLGARCTDTLSGLGPPPLSPGSRLPIGAPLGPPAAIDHVPRPPHPAVMRVRVMLGPRDDWFTAPRELLGRAYTVGEGDRIGVRLRGPALTRARTGELPSEGLAAGAVQVPGDGQPLVFLADHPVTGGYPVVAVVHPADLDTLAQARPGTTVTFHGSQR